MINHAWRQKFMNYMGGWLRKTGNLLSCSSIDLSAFAINYANNVFFGYRILSFCLLMGIGCVFSCRLGFINVWVFYCTYCYLLGRERFVQSTIRGSVVSLKDCTMGFMMPLFVVYI